MAARRLDRIAPGSAVTLDFYRAGEIARTELALFVGIVGEGDDRRARFISYTSDRDDPMAVRPYDWDAYRYEGRWVYGSSADRLSVADVTPPPAQPARARWCL